MENKEVTYTGMKLYPWQKAVVEQICNKRGTSRICCVKAHRQCGKSYMCEGILLHYALNHKRTRNAIISPVLSQSRKIFKDIVDAVYESGAIKKKNETLLEIEFINGSTIIFRSGEMGDSLRGQSINGILI